MTSLIFRVPNTIVVDDINDYNRDNERGQITSIAEEMIPYWYSNGPIPIKKPGKKTIWDDQ